VEVAGSRERGGIGGGRDLSHAPNPLRRRGLCPLHLSPRFSRSHAIGSGTLREARNVLAGCDSYRAIAFWRGTRGEVVSTVEGKS
jgi:hypothetical protein